jgi:hypothetical protein
MRSGLPRYVPTSAHDWGQVLLFQGKSCSHFRSFTNERNRLRRGLLILMVVNSGDKLRVHLVLYCDLTHNMMLVANCKTAPHFELFILKFNLDF